MKTRTAYTPGGEPTFLTILSVIACIIYIASVITDIDF